MNNPTLVRFIWPLAALGLLLAAACLASVWTINRLQADLGESLRSGAADLQAAQELQIQLRSLRTHLVVQAADPTEARDRQVAEDRRRFADALDALRRSPRPPEDARDLDALEQGYRQYLGPGGPRRRRTPGIPVGRGAGPLVGRPPGAATPRPGRSLTERCADRMTRALAQSESQSRWANAALLAVGLAGPLAGLGAGYAVARGWSRRVARLSVRVRAVQAHLDQDVGAMTLEVPEDIGELDRQLERVVGRVKDVCERVQAQGRDILRAEQLAAVGHLAAGVAHEVRNPLTGIKLLVGAALRPADPTPLTREDLEMIRGEIERLERTAQGLLDFAKPARPSLQVLDLRGLIARAADVVRPRADHQAVRLDFELPAGSLVARVDPDQFASLLSNLILNALDATPPGGRVGVGAGVNGAGMIELSVSDGGPGIDPTVANRLFTPFATTKPTGTGLGLSVTRRIAEDHGGTLTAANRPGGGACFTAVLPAPQSDPTGTDAEAPGR